MAEHLLKRMTWEEVDNRNRAGVDAVLIPVGTTEQHGPHMPLDTDCDLVYLTDEYPTHKACAERGITHYENLNNLKEVIGERFLFVGLPLRLETAYGSPVRAAAILEG